jgi:predicted CXXCH cytochrome family protein
MKKALSLLVAAGLIAVATTAMASSITNSKHNLSVTGTGTFKGTASNNTQICVYCHTPHNAVIAIPLWNRNNPAGNLFTLYSGINMTNISNKSGFTSDSISLFCMSCHDGTTNFNDVANTPAYGGPLYSASLNSGRANFGHDLSNTHPVNFYVSTNNTDNDLHVGAANKMGKAGYEMPLFKAAGRDGNVGRALECSSCHAVHDSTNQPFLRYTMDGSKLCLGCHDK